MVVEGKKIIWTLKENEIDCDNGCDNGACLEEVGVLENKKDLDKYSEDGVFLISDTDWRSVLQLVPVVTWSGDFNSDCKRGYDLPDGVCVYPLLVYHEEDKRDKVNLVKYATVMSSSDLASDDSFSIDENVLTHWNSGTINSSYLMLDFKKERVMRTLELVGSAEPYYVDIYYSGDDVVSCSDYEDSNGKCLNSAPKGCFSEYIGFDFDVPKGGEGDVYFCRGAPKDLVEWKKIVDSEVLDREKSVFDLGGISARYIKIEFSDSEYQTIKPNWKQVSEIRVFGDEEFFYNAIDVDSVSYFLNQFNVGNINFVELISGGFDKFMTHSKGGISSAWGGIGINKDKVSKISIIDYLSYWKSYKDVVYVEDDYETALMASVYASFINAPLIVSGGELDLDKNFNGRNIICVGDVSRDCDKRYSLRELRKLYVDETKTDKVILVNPDDLNMRIYEKFSPRKTSGSIYDLFSKTSLVAPILASAKQEVVISIRDKDYRNIDSFIEEEIERLSSDESFYEDSIVEKSSLSLGNGLVNLIKRNLESGEEWSIFLRDNVRGLRIKRDILSFFDSKNGFNWVNLNSLGGGVGLLGEIQKFNDGLLQDFLEDSYDFDDGKIVYKKYIPETKSLGIYLMNFSSGKSNLIYSVSDYIYGYYNTLVSLDGDRVVFSSGAPADKHSEYSSSFYEVYMKDSNGLVLLGNGSNVALTNLMIRGGYVVWLTSDYKISVYNIESGENFTIDDYNYVYFRLYNNYIMAVEVRDSGDYALSIINIDSGEKKYLDDRITFSDTDRPGVYGDFLLWVDSGEDSGGHCLKYPNENCAVDLDCGGYKNTCVGSKINIYSMKEKKVVKEIFDESGYNFVLNGDEIYYLRNNEYREDYKIKYLTIFAANNAIASKYRIYYSSFGIFADSLDQKVYGEMYSTYKGTDLFVGRVQGISVSDVSSYIARVLFYEDISEKSKNKLAIIIGNSKKDDFNGAYKFYYETAPRWTEIFSAAKYYVECLVGESSNDLCLIYKDKKKEFAFAMKNRETIYLGHHGSASAAGLEYNEIPKLSPSVFLVHSCSTCSSYSGTSFCNNVIREGAVGYVGAIGITFDSDKAYDRVFERMYKDGESTGEAIQYAYSGRGGNYVLQDAYPYTTLFGDPTFNFNADYRINESLDRFYGEPE